MIFNNSAKAIPGKVFFFQQKVLEQMDVLMQKKINHNPHLTPHIKLTQTES
jgi:hypothetical protein